MTTVTASPLARSFMARWAGGLYLTYILLSIVASLLGNIGLSDAKTLHATITGDETMFRLGLVAALGSGLLFALTAWALYVLLRPVDGTLALLFLVLNAVGVAVQCASYLPFLTVLAQGDGTGLDGLALLSLTTYQTGFVMAQLFFSAWLSPLGWLVLRSGFLPSFLGWLLILDGAGVLVWFLQVFLAPEHPAISYPAWAVGFVAEFGLALWLVVKGAGPKRKAPTTSLPTPWGERPLQRPRRAGPLGDGHFRADPDLGKSVKAVGPEATCAAAPIPASFGRSDAADADNLRRSFTGSLQFALGVVRARDPGRAGEWDQNRDPNETGRRATAEPS